MPNKYYVRAKISADGDFADCAYYTDKAGTERIDGSVLRISQAAGACVIEQTSNTTLVLVGASYKTIGQPPAMNSSNFAAADDQNAVSVVMPTDSIVTKGVVLLFGNPVAIENLYPSSDPQVLNDA